VASRHPVQPSDLCLFISNITIDPCVCLGILGGAENEAVLKKTSNGCGETSNITENSVEKYLVTKKRKQNKEEE
jgi:hypothetical protein